MNGGAHNRDLQFARREELGGGPLADKDHPEAFVTTAQPRIPTTRQVPAAEDDLDVLGVAW